MKHIKKFESFNEGVAYKDTKKKHERSDEYGNKKEDFRKKIKDFIKSLDCTTKQVGNDLEMSYKGKYVAQIMLRDNYIGIKKESNKFPKEFKYNELGKVKEELKSLIKTNENIKEGEEIGNQKYGPVKCDDCGHQDDGFKFRRAFSKKLKCPKCKSINISDVERPKVMPAPQKSHQENLNI